MRRSGAYCASVGVILADIKMADDIQDGGSWKGASTAGS